MLAISVAATGACFADANRVDPSGGDDTGTTAATSDVGSADDSTDGPDGTGNDLSASDSGTTLALGSSGGSGDTRGTTGGDPSGSGNASSGSTDTGVGETTGGNPMLPDCCDYPDEASCNMHPVVCTFVDVGKENFCDSICSDLDSNACNNSAVCFWVNEDTCVPGSGSSKKCGQGG